MLRQRSSVCACVLFLSAAATLALAQQPTTAQQPTAAPEANAAGWGAESTIPAQWHQDIRFGAPGCPLVGVGTKIYDIQSGRELAEIEKQAPNLRLAFSDDGKYVAVGNRFGDAGTVRLYEASTGKKLHEFPTSAGCEVLAFAGGKQIFASAANDSLDVFDIETKAKLRTIKLPKRIAHDKFALSPDGTVFCTEDPDGLVVCQAATGKAVSRLGMSTDEPAPPVTPKAVVKRGLPSPKGSIKKSIEGRLSVAWLRGLSFSPTGDEIAGVTSNRQPRLLCWNNKGKLLLDIPISDVSRGFDATFCWLPDKAGWVANGLVIDRASKRAVLRFAGDPSVTIVGKDQIFGRFTRDTQGKGDQTLRSFTIPWADIRDAVKAMSAKAPAILAPYAPVAIEVKVADARGNAADVEKIVREALTERLADDGIKVKAGAETIIRVTVSEKAGEVLPVFERSSKFDFSGRDTGRKATEAKGTSVVEIIAAGEAEALWRDVLESSNSRSIEGDVTDATIRESMLERLSQQLNRLSLPYFIPKSETTLALPAIVQ